MTTLNGNLSKLLYYNPPGGVRIHCVYHVLHLACTGQHLNLPPRFVFLRKSVPVLYSVHIEQWFSTCDGNHLGGGVKKPSHRSCLRPSEDTAVYSRVQNSRKITVME